MFDLLSLFLFPFFGTIKSESYPRALTTIEEKEYIDKMKEGDYDARNKLIEHNLRLVAHIVKKYENTFEDKDDILSIGILGLIKAVDSFNCNALNKLATGSGLVLYNLGTGNGYSVLDIVHAFDKAVGTPIPYKIAPRRPGDIATCYADPAKAKAELGWEAKRGIDEMCADGWRWQSQNPNGYRK